MCDGSSSGGGGGGGSGSGSGSGRGSGSGPPEMTYCSSGLKATEVANVMCAPFTYLMVARVAASNTTWSPAVVVRVQGGTSVAKLP